MKTGLKFLLFGASFLMMLSSKAQNFSGNDIRNACNDLVPELNLQNKILFINVWQSSDLASRENNKEFLRVSSIYEKAKLKNGPAGIVFINLSIDNELYNWIIATKKDSLVSNYNLENTSGKYKSLANYFDGKTGNMVIGSDGTLITRDIKKEDCFNLFKSFITR